jgi:uncharacterized protein (TIGR02246 family)
MQTTLLRIVSASVLLLFTGCQAGAPEFTADDEAAIRAASQKYAQTALANDAEGWAEISTTDAIFMPESSKSIEGRDAILAWVKASPPTTGMELTIHEVLGRSDLAIVRGSYKYSDKVTTGAGNYIEIWQRQTDGAWRIIRDIWNSDQAPPTPAPAPPAR